MSTLINLNTAKKTHLVFDKPGGYVVFFKNLSGELTFEITAPKVNVELFGIYSGKKADEFIVRTIQDHKAPDSTSNLLIKGVFDDASKFLYSGLVRIAKGAQGSHAYQKNQNLLLSKNVFVSSEPNLEILANDVFCTHGSTTGKINEEQVLYLQSRGIDRKSAEKLIVEGFLQEVVDKVTKKVPEFNDNFL